MTLALLIAAGIVTGIIIGRARRKAAARKAYAARVAAWQEAQGEKARIAAERERMRKDAERMQAINARLREIREAQKAAERAERLEAWREANARHAEIDALRIEKMKRELEARPAAPTVNPDAEKWEKIASQVLSGMKLKPDYLEKHRAEIMAAIARLEARNAT